ncbi:DUF1330 domain-containing protein [Trinickia dinghuensis]|uniref:DUF1330 domain-containing protein n=1 Tax=Trinickia dinghuensis TaxID=2291023 RepID=A0A3D8K0S5_9BURK|nr:DUF1330 domain-containing protein [Trinickia dinghuensis]RDU99033.1 DUF1330 domain-containing protein [Trinickia dinghuensis]
MKGYWIVLGQDVTDQVAQKQYVELWAPIAEKYQAKLKLLDASVALKESLGTRRVMAVEFPSYAAAKACYEEAAYQNAKEFAVRASKRELLIIEADLA